MKVTSQTYHVPKAGTSERDYEDAAFPLQADQLEKDRKTLRFAVADGATESSFSREWARRLVRHFGAGTLTASTIESVVPRLQERWKRQVARRPLQWFAEAAASRGAFSAFVGVTLIQENDRQAATWSAFAIGDSSIFLVRQNQLETSFPMSSSGDFNNSPFLLSTHSDQWPDEFKAIRFQSGPLHDDDRLYLMTDAIAQWFLSQHEQGNHPWSVLDDLNTQEATHGTFAEFVEDLRVRRCIRNDDTTVVRVDITL